MHMSLFFLLNAAVYASWPRSSIDLKRTTAESGLTSTEHCAAVLRVYDDRLMSHPHIPTIIGQGVRVFCMDLTAMTGSRWNWLKDKDGQFIVVNGYWGAQEVCNRRYWLRWFQVVDPVGATVNWYTSCKLTVWAEMCGDQNGPGGRWVPQPAQSTDDDYNAFRLTNEANVMLFAPAAITVHRPFFALSRSAAFNHTFQRQNVEKVMKC